MKHIDYQTQGTCSRIISLTASDDGRIADCQVLGGCNGNLKGICSLIKGMPLEAVRDRLQGIRCKEKPTSCPDQISRAIDALLKQ